MGIQTLNPEYPLTVNGTKYHRTGDTYYGSYLYYVGSLDSGYLEGTYLNIVRHHIAHHATTNRDFIAYFAGDVFINGGLVLQSDKSIKTDISNIDDDRALQKVNQLESKEYHYIDPLRRRPMKTIGFIAQEVKEVIPNAVTLQKCYIPDEMRIITDPQWREDGGKYYLNIPDLDMSGAFTGKGKFYVSNDPSGNDEVCKEVDIKEVPTSSMNEFSTTKYVAEFEQSWNNVFFYGKEVTDFHTLDKAQIFALHHSAIQELDRKHKREVTEKNNKIQTLEGQVSKDKYRA